MSRALLAAGVVLVAMGAVLYWRWPAPEEEVEPPAAATPGIDEYGKRVSAALPRGVPDVPPPEAFEGPVENDTEGEDDDRALGQTAWPPSTTPNGNTVSGRVVFDGTPPELPLLTVTKDQNRGCCEAGEAFDDRDRRLLIDDTNGIANVVVTIRVPGIEVAPSPEPIAIEQSKCRFEPHVRVVPVGTTVRFQNEDRIAHNVHTYARINDSTNRTVAPRDGFEQVLPSRDRIEIKCDIHPWMQSWVLVVDTPYYAITDSAGRFEIGDLPDGELVVEFWHELLGTHKDKATVNIPGHEKTDELVVRMEPPRER